MTKISKTHHVTKSGVVKKNPITKSSIVNILSKPKNVIKWNTKYGLREGVYRGWLLSEDRDGLFYVSKGDLSIGKYPLSKAIKKIDEKNNKKNIAKSFDLIK